MINCIVQNTSFKFSSELLFEIELNKLFSLTVRLRKIKSDDVENNECEKWRNDFVKSLTYISRE